MTGSTKLTCPYSLRGDGIKSLNGTNSYLWHECEVSTKNTLSTTYLKYRL